VDPRVDFLIGCAKRDFRQNISVDVMACMVNISTSHLAHLFKREANVSLKHFVREIRLQHAKRLLETSFLSVKQVMVSSGFNDASHFVRDFKQVYGKTPSEYRRSHRCSVSANE
jgi:two-component system response regulator YesN